jgi:uncharacterized protein GlcG (DUF336 family)
MSVRQWQSIDREASMRSLKVVMVMATTVSAGLWGAGLFAQTLTVHRISASLAQEAVGEAVASCAKQGYKVTATVIDPEGIRIALLHGDGSGVHTIEAAYAKAFAAVSFAAPVLGLDTSGQLGERVAQQPNFQFPSGMLFRAGGVVIKQGEEVIGAIGVGGAPGADKDEGCARAGIDKIKDRIK